MRATTLLRRLLDLPGITVRGFTLQDGRLDVALTRHRLVCPLCDYVTWLRYDTRPVPSRWRHLDLAATW